MTKKKTSKETTSTTPEVRKPQQPTKTTGTQTRLFDSYTGVRSEHGTKILNEKKDK